MEGGEEGDIKTLQITSHGMLGRKEMVLFSRYVSLGNRNGGSLGGHLSVVKFCWCRCVGWERYILAAVPLGWQAFGVLAANVHKHTHIFWVRRALRHGNILSLLCGVVRIAWAKREWDSLMTCFGNSSSLSYFPLTAVALLLQLH